MLPIYFIMKRVNWIHFYHNFDLLPRCGPLARIVTSAAVSRKVYLNKSSILKLKHGVLTSQRKKYEDTFGNLESFETDFMKIKEDPEDAKDYLRDKAAQGKKIPQYIKEVAEHLRNKDYKSALQVLEVDMYNDRKPPVAWIYTDLIMYNARIGNLEEAYRLYTNFKKFGGKPSRAMYTAMFAACQFCRNTDLALKAATAVREYLLNDGNLKPNNTHYRAMIAAFGKHGDFATCFKIFDELIYKRDKFSAKEFHSIFYALLNDQNAGLRHALLLWRKMIQYRIRPTLEVFHDLLDCVKCCSLGDINLLPDLMKEIDEQSRVFVRNKVVIKTETDYKKRTILKIPADGKAWYLSLKPPGFEKELEILKENANINVELKEKENIHSDSKETLLYLKSQENTVEEKSKTEFENKSKNIMQSEEELSVRSVPKEEEQKSHHNLPEMSFTPKQSELPNLIAFEPTFGSVLEFKSFTKAQHRFMLLGGLRGFLKVMFEFGVTPTSKTLTQLLFLVPKKKEAYEEILHLAKVLNIKLDTEFFNALMKLQIFLGEDFNCAQKYIQLIQEHKLQPDLFTFGTLALSCVNLKDASELVKSVHNFGFRLNSQIVGGLLNKAVFVGDLEYVKGILDIVKELEVQVDGKFTAKLANFIEKHKYLKDAKDAENKLYTYSRS